MTETPTSQIPGVYHRRIGDIVVTAISDGYLDGAIDVLRNISVDESTAMLRAAFRPVPRRTAVNAFVVRSKGRCALIETGSGDYMGPTAGWVRRNLAAAGVDRADIEAVLLTHMHPDHSAGLADMTSGTPFFPNAELVVHEKEPPHWHDDAAMARATEREQRLYFQCARDQFAPYRDRVRTFTGGEVFPGVTAVPIPGHTPGHTAYMVHSGAEQLLIWGDTVHVPEVQVRRPEVCIAFDTDPVMAAATRKRLFDMAATDRLLVAGMHLAFPAFSHLVRQGDGYALLPEAWDYMV